MTNPASPTPPPPARGDTALNATLQLAARGWTTGLSVSVLAGLGLETVSGLWILLAPFSVLSQLGLLLHTVAGLLLLAPCFLYFARHWFDWRDQPLSVVKLLGYAGLLLLTTCFASGGAVTWNCIFGRRLSPLWDQIHLATGLASATLVVVHLALAYLRRRAQLHTLPNFGRRLRRHGAALAFGLAGAYIALVTVAMILPSTPVSRPLPDGYSLPEYAQQFDEYRGSPFAPTFARTATGGLINPELLAHSASCGTTGCHEEILAEWEPSAHRFAAMNPPFQTVQKSFADDRSPADTRYCAGCHDPISLFAGAKDIHNLSLSAPGMQEGISCVVCHSISHVDQRGNADYVLTPPTRYLGEAGSGIAKRVSDFLIRAYPRQHLADYDRNILRTPEFCGACHKQFIPEALNRFGANPAQNQFDEWRQSHWNHAGDPDKTLSCRDCHMRLVPESRDPGAGEAGDIRRATDDRAHRHHGTIATNLFMPAVLKLPHWEEQFRLTQEWIKGETVLPEIAHLWPAGPVAPLQIHAPASAAPGQTVELQVVVNNHKAGHNFISGPLDFLRVWVHLRVHDAAGQLVGEWGGIDPLTREIFDEPGVIHEPGRARDAGTLVFEGMPVDDAGQTLRRHELWRKAGGTGNRVLFPGYADKQTYRLAIPVTARGPLTITADLNFRRYRQEFLNLVLPTMEADAGVFQPTITKNSATRTITLASPESPAPTP